MTLRYCRFVALLLPLGLCGTMVHAQAQLDPKWLENPQVQEFLKQYEEYQAQKTQGRIQPVASNPNPNPASVEDLAFQELLRQAVPLNPDQIKTLRQKQDDSQEAVAAHPKVPPKPISSTLTVDLSPGATPPVIRLAAGFVSSLVFLDATGKPWPVADYSLGDPQSFDIEWDKVTNTLFVQSLKSYGTANLAVRLAKLDTPVMISLVNGQRMVDYRVDLQVPGQGPNAVPTIAGDNIVGGPSSELLSVLDGIPPRDSMELQVVGATGRAWMLSSGKIILRTKMVVLSPAWYAQVSSADGTRVYEMPKTPLILASHEGRTIKIEIKGL